MGRVKHPTVANAPVLAIFHCRLTYSGAFCKRQIGSSANHTACAALASMGHIGAEQLSKCLQFMLYRLRLPAFHPAFNF
jgi:hypothetical protein